MSERLGLGSALAGCRQEAVAGRVRILGTPVSRGGPAGQYILQPRHSPSADSIHEPDASPSSCHRLIRASAAPALTKRSDRRDRGLPPDGDAPNPGPHTQPAVLRRRQRMAQPRPALRSTNAACTRHAERRARWRTAAGEDRRVVECRPTCGRLFYALVPQYALLPMANIALAIRGVNAASSRLTNKTNWRMPSLLLKAFVL